MTDTITADEVVVRVRAAVKDIGSQRAFAAKHSMTMSLVSDVLNGKRKPTPKVMRAIGVDPGSLVKPSLSETGRRWWTPEFIEQVMQAADSGMNSTQVARHFSMGVHAFRSGASRCGVRFDASGKAIRAAAVDQLSREIHAAHVEASTTPLYRGGW